MRLAKKFWADRLAPLCIATALWTFSPWSAAVPDSSTAMASVPPESAQEPTRRPATLRLAATPDNSSLSGIRTESQAPTTAYAAAGHRPAVRTAADTVAPSRFRSLFQPFRSRREQLLKGDTPAQQFADLLRAASKPKTDLLWLADRAEALADFAAEQAEMADATNNIPKKQLAGLPADQLRAYFTDSPDLLAGREIRGLRQMARLARSVHNARSEAERARDHALLQEVIEALRINRRSPVPATVGMLSPFKILFRGWARSVGHGTRPAANVPAATNGVDPGALDPFPSTFWTRPPSISNQDLRIGFGRTALPDFTREICEYDGPKTSSGTKAGFDVEYEGVDYQVKFSEVGSEPFTARIFHALGYHVDPTDYAPFLKIRYNRRLFREFNLRQPLTMRIRPFGIPVAEMNFQPHYDPFDFIQEAVFKDGRRVSGAELKQLLLHRPHGENATDDPNNFRTEIESALDYLVTVPANIQPEDHPAKTIGCWDFVGLGHEDLRELRAVALLGAWLAWFDARFDNTRLRVLVKGDDVEFQHFFTDLGAGLGKGTGRFFRKGERVDLFEWTFTEPEIVRGPGRMTTPFRVVNYQTLVPCPAFRAMTVDDARWMARLIGQLTETQLRDALEASGYTGDEARL